MLRGEAAWGLITKLRREEVDEYLLDRQAKGINALVVMLVSHHYLIGPTANIFGQEPFTTAFDFATPNEAYFQHADHVLSRAAEKGMLVILAPAYSGYEGGTQQGWLPYMLGNGVAKMRAWGHYVGSRYKNHKNILWLIGGDYNPASQAEKDIVRAVANGIRDAVPDALQTSHGARNMAAMQYWGTAEPWLTVNDLYTSESQVVASAQAEHTRSTLPYFLVEAIYERADSSNARVIRQQAYQAALSGAIGSVIGHDRLWPMGPDWRNWLNTPGVTGMVHLGKTLGGTAWWTLQPDASGSFLTAGAGVAQDQAVAAVAADRSFAMAYVPTLRGITLNLGRLAGPKVKARWIDPVSGTWHDAVGSPFPAAGEQAFHASRKNSGGASDWALKLESVP